MRILVIGSNGMLGRDLVQEWQSHEVIPATSRDADVRDFEQVRRLVSTATPDWIILAAAYTDVDRAESDPERSFSVNREGARNVALSAKEAGAKLLYVSTDYVFDGNSARPYEPNDPVHPLSVYGASKAAGEQAIRETLDQWIIARTSWLFGASSACFPEKILRAAETQPELKVVNDQFGSPTYSKDLAGAIRELVRTEARGVLHITNAGSCSWFEFAKEILLKAGRATLVSPISTAEAHRPARRPAYSVLSPRALIAYGIRLRNWQEALGAYLGELRRKGQLL
jgi:dTDP-4-dehydrorhamnose reductase